MLNSNRSDKRINDARRIVEDAIRNFQVRGIDAAARNDRKRLTEVLIPQTDAIVRLELTTQKMRVDCE